MGISATELLGYVIQPTLAYLGLNSTEAEYALLGQAGARSALGGHLEDHGSLGVFGIDRDSHRELWDNFLAFRPELASKVRGLASQHEFLSHPDAELATNLAYSTAIAWCMLAQKPEDWTISMQLQDCSQRWLRTFDAAPAAKKMSAPALAA